MVMTKYRYADSPGLIIRFSWIFYSIPTEIIRKNEYLAHAELGLRGFEARTFIHRHTDNICDMFKYKHRHKYYHRDHTSCSILNTHL